MEQFIHLNTACGPIKGLDKGAHAEFLGVKFANAGRFEYAIPVTNFKEAIADAPDAHAVDQTTMADRIDAAGVYDATYHGDVCTQKRVWFEHLEVPERKFYHTEFRQGQQFTYSEDCLNLDIYMPKAVDARSADMSSAPKYPVIIFIHGGGFDSGSCYDSAINGAALAERGVVCVSIQYRVGIFGYFTHEDIAARYGHEGNFGLDDQYTAIKWVKDNIADYCGDSDNITVMGQSAGAISIQYLCLSEKCRGLFQHALMMSGGGLFPKFALPRLAENTHEYWQDCMTTAGVSTLEELKSLDSEKIFTACEELRTRRKDNTYNTMPVVDQYLISAPVDTLIDHPLPIDYMIGYTNNDMYAIIMAYIGNKFGRANGAYVYYFDIDAPGDDNNAAFHSADIRYLFGTLKASHRPYSADDEAVSSLMMDYVVRFAATGNPNHDGAPQWDPEGRKPLHVVRDVSKIRMARPNQWQLLHNTLTKGDPK